MASQYVKIATCTLNQWAMDFQGNKERIVQSIIEAKRTGAKLRLGPELEIPGYTCEDHFLEPDTFHHSTEVLAEIIEQGVTTDIVCNIGTIFYHNSIPYNCRVAVLDGKILYIRPKMHLAGDGNYREMRWFSAWTKKGIVEKHLLPPRLVKATGQKFVPFGHCFLQTNDTKVADEMCEELWVPESPHISYGLCGVEIFLNGSGSHHQLRKLNRRIELIRSASARGGGVYVYSNLIGCDGGRLNFDGSSLVAVNGDVVKQGKQFSLEVVSVTTAVVDLEQVRMYRMGINARNQQGAHEASLSYVERGTEIDNHGTAATPKGIFVDFNLCMDRMFYRIDQPVDVKYFSPEQEIAYGPAQWCWDYLRRSGASGFFLPLSGGADSSSTAAIIGNMCHMVIEAIEQKNESVINDVKRILGLNRTRDLPTTPEDLCGELFHTCYMGTTNSSAETRNFAEGLAKTIGSSHHSVVIDTMVKAVLGVFMTVAEKFRKKGKKAKEPTYHIGNKGSPTEDKALQNIQARLRMVFAYLMAQLLRWLDNRNGWLLVLGSANVDEGLRGYLTKYDCSSADLNPIGGICKTDLKSFLRWASRNELNYGILGEIVEAPPSAELKPSVKGEIQKDEDEMGMTYEELTRFGKLRKIGRCGPVSMFKTLVQEWTNGYSKPGSVNISVREVAEKVKRFFRYYSMNRHKMTTLTPAVHMENYSPEDNRHDLRQIFYNVSWPYQFKKIDEIVKSVENPKSNM